MFLFSVLSRRCPLLATFLSVLVCLLSLLISDSRFDLVWFRLSCDHGWIRSGSVNVRKTTTMSFPGLAGIYYIYIYIYHVPRPKRSPMSFPGRAGIYYIYIYTTYISIYIPCTILGFGRSRIHACRQRTPGSREANMGSSGTHYKSSRMFNMTAWI